MTLATLPRHFPSTIPNHSQCDRSRVVQAAIDEALFLAGYGALRRVEVGCDDDVVTISGHVPSFYLKQVVQNIAAAVPGVRRVKNQMQVC